MHESDTDLAILDEGQEKRARRDILLIGEKRLGPADDSIKTRLDGLTDLNRLDRMILEALSAASWQQILDTR